MPAALAALVLLHGVVMRGPTKPVCDMATPCSEPAAHVVLDFRGPSGELRVRTDAQGRYAIRLRTGRYLVRIVPRAPIGGGLQPAVVVVRRAMRADFDLDTGIR